MIDFYSFKMNILYQEENTETIWKWYNWGYNGVDSCIKAWTLSNTNTEGFFPTTEPEVIHSFEKHCLCSMTGPKVGIFQKYASEFIR